MKPLSVVIITFNEEKNIGRCLDSVQEVADEIIVLDSFSQDHTAEIAKSKGAKNSPAGIPGLRPPKKMMPSTIVRMTWC